MTVVTMSARHTHTRWRVAGGGRRAVGTLRPAGGNGVGMQLVGGETKTVAERRTLVACEVDVVLVYLAVHDRLHQRQSLRYTHREPRLRMTATGSVVSLGSVWALSGPQRGGPR